MSWLEDVLAQLQGGGAPAAYSPQPGGFPDIPRPLSADEEARLAAEARDAAGARMVRSNQRRSLPFGGVPGADSAGVQLALDNAPPGTGVPGPLGQPPITPQELAMMPGATGAIRAGAPDGTIFGGVPDMSQFNPMTLSPSMQTAKVMTAPPVPPPGPQGPIPGLLPPGSVPGMPAGPGPIVAADDGEDTPTPAKGPTDVSAQRRTAPMGPIDPAMFATPRKGFADSLADIGSGLVAMGAVATGEGSGASERLALRRQAEAEKLQGQNMTAQWLLARGAPPSEVAAAVRSPEVLKSMITKYGENKNAQVINGRLVRVRPDGTVETLADYHDDKDKAPTQRTLKLPNGSEQQQEYITGKGWQNVGEPAPGQRDRRLSVGDVTKLSEEGGKLRQIEGFVSSFKPEFGGWKVNTVGDLANLAGRNLPESVVGKDVTASAGWWQDYDRYKNMVRHELFGSALTKGEQEAFMRADIGPGMTPEQITRNLATQKRVVEQSIRRKGKGLIGSTYDKAGIASAYGVPEEFFDQPDTPPDRGGTIQIGGKSVPWSLK